ncbi:MAG: sigma factor G inhibitor Gin [Firmicutes bacterium]|nr:sigma factor G inhibitor Gin [Bacillota bacterium]
MSTEKCLICSRPTEAGLRILTSLVCSDCEQELLNTDVTDPRYNLFVEKLKQVWPHAKAAQSLG